MSGINQINQTNETTQKTYQIGGRRFWVAPIVARQEQWLWPILRPMYLQGESIMGEQILSLLVDQVTRVSAILLIPDGMTQEGKCVSGLRGVDELQAWLDSTVNLEALAPVLRDFFTSGHVATISRGVFGIMAASLPTAGSSAPSASSAAATSPAPTGSGATSALLMPDPILSASRSDKPPISPSASLQGSSCPG